MYESKETSIRGIVVTILLIILVICVLIWIFPTKKDVKGISTNDTLLSEVYGRNLRILQNAGRSYYYSATLPKNVGDSTSITLNDLVEKKMLLDLKDKNGKLCDKKASYVQLTKKSSSEYEMKSYLSCGKEADYLLATLGCANFKSNCKSVTPVVPDVKPDEEVTGDYKYLYKCPSSSKTWSSWSNWSTDPVYETSTRKVETKVEVEQWYVKVQGEPTVTYVTKEVEETNYVKATYYQYEGKTPSKPIPANARNCVAQARTDLLTGENYTRYDCEIPQVKKVTKQEPVYNYNDTYQLVNTAVTYYRYKTLKNSTSYTEKWSFNPNNKTLLDEGCTVIKSERVDK